MHWQQRRSHHLFPLSWLTSMLITPTTIVAGLAIKAHARKIKATTWCVIVTIVYRRPHYNGWAVLRRTAGTTSNVVMIEHERSKQINYDPR